jgi:hypothetical protein
MFLVIQVPKNSNFGQKLNFSGKSKNSWKIKNTNTSVLFKYETILGGFGTLK